MDLRFFIVSLLFFSPQQARPATVASISPTQLANCYGNLNSLQPFWPPQWQDYVRDAYWLGRTKLLYRDDPSLLEAHVKAKGHSMNKGSIATSYLVKDNPHRFRKTGSYGLAERLLSGEDHPEWLVQLGFTLKKRTSDGKWVLVPPVDPAIIFINANKIIKTKIEAGSIKEDDAIYLAIPFVKLDSQSEEDPNYYLFIRPGIDSWPSPDIYKMDFRLPQLSHVVWQKAFAEGKQPFSLGDFLDHDLGHYTEFLRDDALMKATRDFYRWASRQPDEWQKELSTFKADYYMEDSIPHRYALRAWFFAESFSLPDISKSDQIKPLVKHLLDHPELANIGQEVKRLESLNREGLVNEVRNFLDRAQTLIIRQGGSIRDSHNHLTLMSDHAMWEALSHSLFRKERNGILKPPALFIAAKEDKFFLETALNAITYENLVTQFLELYDLLDQWEFHDKTYRVNGANDEYMSSDFYRLFQPPIIDKFARMEIAFYSAIRYQITPAQIVIDAGNETVDQNSLTAQYLRSFVPRGSAMWLAFLRD